MGLRLKIWDIFSKFGGQVEGRGWPSPACVPAWLTTKILSREPVITSADLTRHKVNCQFALSLVQKFMNDRKLPIFCPVEFSRVGRYDHVRLLLEGRAVLVSNV